MVKCEICDREFKNEHNLKVHVTKKHKAPRPPWNKGLTKETSEIVKQIAETQTLTQKFPHIEFSGICKNEKCKKPFSYIAHPSSFPKACCSRKCSNSFGGNAAVGKHHGRPGRPKLVMFGPIKPRKYRKQTGICVVCNLILSTPRKYCSEHLRLTLSKAGLKSSAVQSVIRRSKNEIAFAEICKKKFSSVRTNEQIFNGWDADVIIDDVKIAVMWNGPWHRRKITRRHSVAEVQNRDRIKIKEIIAFGYIPYVIDDESKKDKNFVLQEFEKFMVFVSDMFPVPGL